MTIQFGGTTGEAVTGGSGRGSTGPGNRRPVLIGWFSPTDQSLVPLTGDALGYGEPDLASVNGHDVYVSGEIGLRQGAMRAGFDGPDSLGATLLHEWGHVIGLEHTGDRRQLMYGGTSPTTVSHFQSGDRAGLRRLGDRSGCR
ncbi:MAG: matrixin family metalloprotease [Mycobacteriales bacterium]|nr:matrixin family metalloprotease [Frankia sp.]